MHSIRTFFIACVFVPLSIAYAQYARGVEPADDIRLDVPEGWRGERIELPPSFAKDLKLKGVEKIRFSPGMFQPEARDFFSYVIVFRLDDQPDLSRETLSRELLVYYRGLAKAVSGGKIKTEGFSIEVTPDKKSQIPDTKEFTATLNWIEPFTTKKLQVLRIEIRTWETPANRRTWVFMSVSPNKSDDPIWKTMRKVRDNFGRGS